LPTRRSSDLTPGTRRRLAPSRSLYWAARNLTTAWPTVALMVGICAYPYHTAGGAPVHRALYSARAPQDSRRARARRRGRRAARATEAAAAARLPGGRGREGQAPPRRALLARGQPHAEQPPRRPGAGQV